MLYGPAFQIVLLIAQATWGAQVEPLNPDETPQGWMFEVAAGILLVSYRCG